MGNIIFDTKSGYLLVGKVRPVIKDDGMCEAEVTQDILPQELDHLLPSDFIERNNFDPLSEVVSGNQLELKLSLCLRKRAHHIQSSLYEGQGLWSVWRSSLGLLEDGANF